MSKFHYLINWHMSKEYEGVGLFVYYYRTDRLRNQWVVMYTNKNGNGLELVFGKWFISLFINHKCLIWKGI